MQRIREIQRGRSHGAHACGDGLRNFLAGTAQGWDDVSILAADEEDAALGQAVEVNDAAVMLLHDFQAVAAAGAAAEFGGGRESGMREHEDGSGRWLGTTCAVEQTTRVIGDGDLDDGWQRG